MVKSAQFVKILSNGIETNFSRASVENNLPGESYYDIIVNRKGEKLSLVIKKNDRGFWGIQNRVQLPLWVIDLEPELIRAVKQNEV